MIQFCEITVHASSEPTKGFCFLDTVSDEVCHFNGEWMFSSLDNFLLWAKDTSNWNGTLERFTGKISEEFGGEVDYEA